jgi:hypothetical protein
MLAPLYLCTQRLGVARKTRGTQALHRALGRSAPTHLGPLDETPTRLALLRGLGGSFGGLGLLKRTS